MVTVGLLAVLAVMPALAAAQGSCSARDLAARNAATEAVCCGGTGHRRFLQNSTECLLPDTCSTECAASYVPFLDDCRATIESGGVSTDGAFVRFYRQCTAVRGITVPGHESRHHSVHVPLVGQDTAPAPIPMLVFLHGYTGSGAVYERMMHLSKMANAKRLVLVLPDGLKDSRGAGFWSATDACCNMDGSSVDDSGYLRALILATQAQLSGLIDPGAIFVAGHSNGGFMSYRMACDHSDLVAGIVSIAGAAFDTPTDVAMPFGPAYTCHPTHKINVLQIHGDNDETVSFTGGSSLAPGSFPSAEGSVNRWADFNSCGNADTLSSAALTPAWDLVTPVGAETYTAVRYSGCPANASAELWRVHGGSHTPRVRPLSKSLE